MSNEGARSRRFERVDLCARVEFSSLDPERDPRTGIPTLWESDELCETLSVGGAFIRTADPPAKGRRLLLQIHLPGGESVEAVGRVAWTRVPLRGRRESGVGVEFIASGGEARRTLSRFVARARAARGE
jgi:hypothetical protein